MKDKLEKLLQTKEEARQALVAKSEKSDNVEELRSIQKQIEDVNKEISELRGMIAEAAETEQKAAQKTPEELAAEEREKRAQAEMEKRAKAENRNYIPGKGFNSTAEGRQQVDEKAEHRMKMEERGKVLREGRSVTVGSSSIVVPSMFSDTINPTFKQVSGLVDSVDVKLFNGGESYRQGYLISTASGDYSGETDEYNDADNKYGYADMNKARITAYSEITNQVAKLPAANYADMAMQGITTSVRKMIARQILLGDGATNHLVGIFSTSAEAIDNSTDLSISAIDNTTLDNIIFGYGGDESTEGQAVLILSKKDLAAFARLRSTDGKKFHTIIPNGNGGSGTIDGYPYIINSACNSVSVSGTTAGAYCMAYGNLKNYQLAVFSDLAVERSTDYKFKQGMIAHRGEIYLGGNVISYNGFLRVKKAGTAATTVSPTTATVSIAAATDLSFIVTAGSGVSLTSLSNASATVNSSNYTYSNDTLTLLKAYLAGLTTGVKTFTLNMDDGTTATITVTVSA